MPSTRRTTALAAVLAVLVALGPGPALAMGEKPQGTPGEQAERGASAAVELAKKGELEPALERLLQLATPVLDAYPVDAGAACAIAAAQRACVHEARRHSDRGRWLDVAGRAFTHAIATHRRLAAAYLRQGREPQGRRAPESAYWTTMMEAMEAWIDLFPEIPPQDASFRYNPNLADQERSLPRDRYKKDALALFKALRTNIQTVEEAKAFKSAYRRAVDQVRATHPTTARLNEMVIELNGWTDGLPLSPPR